MRIACPNCGCLHQVDLDLAEMRYVLKKFKIKTGAISCAVIDENGHILASESDKSLSRSTEDKMVALHLAIQDLYDNYAQMIELKSRVETVSFFEEVDLNLKGFIMLMKEIVRGVGFIAIIPSWLNLTHILPRFKSTILRLSPFFNKPESATYVECKLIL